MSLSCAVEVRSYHFRKPARTSRGALDERTAFLLQVTDPTAGPAVGLGEAGPIPGLSPDATRSFPVELRHVVDRFNAAALALPPGDPQEAVAALLAPFADDLIPLPSLAFALETALLDLIGGGRGVLWESAFTRGERTLPTHGLLWMDSSAGLLDQARTKIEAGCTVLKLKVGALQLEDEMALLRAIVDEAPGVRLRLDANGAFSPGRADEFMRHLEALPVDFLEQPIPPGHPDALRALCAASPVPIALDEELIAIHGATDRQALLDAIHPHALILKPSLLGGFAACDGWIADATARGIQWWANSLLEAAVGHSAVVQWLAARDDERVHGLGTGALYLDNDPSPIRLDGCSLRFTPAL